ncbi:MULTISPECIES: elongation factor P 5-aminopentanone reductase [Sporosarcina]|uniref:3-oxoacyl-[acyl-carrier protein] reductase n=2 Tax=Sporosarcina newyorkensis TaxID=759851 RepID=A0A1T4YDF0_9BACL|nr:MULTISPECIES: SDR family oxidoreductase [Sporosarcina]EGQ27456.1 3-oxoacyl-[acyl-carrier-protein] reductase [Sporosarcina newyorkensis 2681]MBY0221997.1 SDR family oxidoreductase [Sporosarcina aquimarina]SKA99857.1 3-oxoacyl-[acyl-carrier protein] reductase [Sporosarcina newyorkensis]
MNEARFALVLGASGGIGEAVCRQLAAAGWSLYLHYNSNKQQLALLLKDLQKDYPNLEFLSVQADFRSEQAAAELASKIQGLQAIVVANGQAVVKLLSDTTDVEMAELWRVHMQNPARLVSLLSAKLRKHTVSYVLFIGSIWGSAGAAGEVMYSAVKGAQHAFVKAYAKEAAYSGVRVNAIAPGWIDTRMNQEFSSEERQMVLEQIPLLSVGTPQEIANMVEFLLSGKADYMTGEIVQINGGWYM